MSVRQQVGETTREYITRFNNEKLEVVDYEEKTTITTLIINLLLEKLYYALVEDPPKTMTEIMGKVEKIMNIEEAMTAKQTTTIKPDC